VLCLHPCSSLQEALQEARMLSQFDHVNIVHYQECVLEVSAVLSPHVVVSLSCVHMLHEQL
jgi:hypothetical protein